MPLIVGSIAEFEREIPYSTARQLFAPVLGDLLPAHLGDGSMPTSEDGLPGWRALYDIAVTLAGSRPLLICVDDVGWIDGDSERFLLYTARQISNVPLAPATRSTNIAWGSGSSFCVIGKNPIGRKSSFNS